MNQLRASWVDLMAIASQRGIGVGGEGLQVKFFVIGSTNLPTTVEDANPFIGQGAHGSVVRSAALPLAFIVSSRPQRLAYGSRGEFVERLSQEFGADQPPVHPMHFAAGFGDRSDAGESLQFLSALEAVAIRAEGRRQTWGQGLASTRQAVKQLLVRMLGKEFFQRLIEFLQGGDHRLELLGQRLVIVN